MEGYYLISSVFITTVESEHDIFWNGNFLVIQAEP